jgi:hypothetical protein
MFLLLRMYVLGQNDVRFFVDPIPDRQPGDSSSMWLYKLPHNQFSPNTEEWCALRESDQIKLSALSDQKTVGVRGGRWSIDVGEKTMSPRYSDGDVLEVRQSLWFWKDGNGANFKPFETCEDERKVEEAYQTYLETQQATTLELGNAFVSFSPGVAPGDAPLAFARKRGGLSSFLPFLKVPLTRGWGSNNSTANSSTSSSSSSSSSGSNAKECRQEPDDPWDDLPSGHLVLVVHGIGESLFTRGDSSLPPFRECVEKMGAIGRSLESNNAQAAAQAQAQEAAEAQAAAYRYGGGGQQTKTEVLPIEWHERLSEKKAQLAPATLPSVPKLRDFANEVRVVVVAVCGGSQWWSWSCGGCDVVIKYRSLPNVSPRLLTFPSARLNHHCPSLSRFTPPQSQQNIPIRPSLTGCSSWSPSGDASSSALSWKRFRP